MSGSIVVAEDSITFESEQPGVQEIIDTLEGYAFDKLGEILEIDDMEGHAEILKTNIDGDVVFTELKVDGVKFVVNVTEQVTDPDNGLSVWLCRIEQL